MSRLRKRASDQHQTCASMYQRKDIMLSRCAGLPSTYTNVDAGDIVADLITSFLSTDGVTAGTISAGAHMDEYNASDKTIGAVLDELSSVSGYQWFIDNSKAMHFIQDIIIPDAAHEIVESGAYTDFRGVKVEEDLSMYRNRRGSRWPSDGTALSYVAEDAAEISARAAIEGRSGVYEKHL